VLDRLLGRAALKERIEELQAERDRLQERLDAESERRAEAVRDRQTAEERANRLEDRIAGLEGELDDDHDDETLDYRRTEELRGNRLERVLDRLRSVEAGPEGALTAAVTDDADVGAPLRGAFGDRAALVRRAAPCVAVTDDAGVVSAALRPPLPPEPFVSWGSSPRLDDAWFRPEAQGRYALAVVRTDRFALGTYDGRERLSVEGFESDVPGRHSKGGFSQARFERRRDEAVTDHLDRCRAALDDRDADRLFLTGDRTALDALDVSAERTATVDATGDPGAALDAAFHSLWTTRLFAV
jgi:peptide subunit release factor 1 (eRF1)